MFVIEIAGFVYLEADCWNFLDLKNGYRALLRKSWNWWS